MKRYFLRIVETFDSKYKTKHYPLSSKEIPRNLGKNLLIQLNEGESIKGNTTATGVFSEFLQQSWFG